MNKALRQRKPARILARFANQSRPRTMQSPANRRYPAARFPRLPFALALALLSALCVSGCRSSGRADDNLVQRPTGQWRCAASADSAEWDCERLPEANPRRRRRSN